jgi:hypothetical protein
MNKDFQGHQGGAEAEMIWPPTKTIAPAEDPVAAHT